MSRRSRSCRLNLIDATAPAGPRAKRDSPPLGAAYLARQRQAQATKARARVSFAADDDDDDDELI
jgi:hypothetical protein